MPIVRYWRLIMTKCPIGYYCSHHDCFCPRAIDTPAPIKRRVSDATKKMQAKLKVASGKHTTISAIASSLNRSPRECRAALRQLGIKKPVNGWQWPPSEAATIKSRLAKKFSGKQSRQSPRRRLPQSPSVAEAPSNDNRVSSHIAGEITSGVREASAGGD